MYIAPLMNQNPLRPLFNSHGFTFLELSIVLSLFTLFFAVTLPVIPLAVDQQKKKGFIQELSGDLYLASNEARTKQVEAMIDIYPAYSFYLLKVNGRQVKKVNAPQGVSLNSNYPNHRVVFYSDGQVTRAGTIKVKDSRGKTTEIIIQLSSGRFWIKNG